MGSILFYTVYSNFIFKLQRAFYSYLPKVAIVLTYSSLKQGENRKISHELLNDSGVE